jgi:DNA-binding NtrC family response regulator
MSNRETSTRSTGLPEGKAYLVLRGVPESCWAFPFLAEPQIIGRQGTCAIRIGDSGVSREHARVWEEAGSLWIRDLGSSNGTRVNGELIKLARVQVADTIKLGEVVLDVCGPREPGTTSPSVCTTILEPEELSAAAAGPAPEPPLREEVAALYSLGGTLGSCSERSEALCHLLAWVSEWLGAEQAAVIVAADGDYRVEAQTTSDQGSAVKTIHWSTVKECLGQGKAARNRVSAADASAAPGDILVVPVPDVKPPAAIYTQWKTGQDEERSGFQELLKAAAQVFGMALQRLSASAESSDLHVDSEAPGSQRVVLIGGDRMNEVFELIKRSARAKVTVLITGETGTGKELVARAIHQTSPWAQGPFIRRNCGAIPESLFENELFGHEAGAFTNAIKRHQGVFEQSDGGSLFLDEIAEIPLHLQSKLLRVLEEHTFARLGGAKEIGVDVRLIAATNRNLAQLVTEGHFRSDLYYRLQVLVIHMPPLRERRKDIRELSGHFLLTACRQMDIPQVRLSPAALQKLEAHDWPGNVRELRNTLERALFLTSGTLIDAEHIVLSESPGRAAPIRSTDTIRLGDLERQYILEVLATVGGNKAKAASILGIDRTTLHRKLNRLQRGGA